MAPRVRPARSAGAKPAQAPVASASLPKAKETAAPTLSAPNSDDEKALSDMKKHVEANSDYVGMNFASEARKIHEGDAPERAIYGEAKPEEAIKLIEDGVPVAPLPFIPKRKAN